VVSWAAEEADEQRKKPADGRRLWKPNGTLRVFFNTPSAIPTSFLIQPPFTWSKLLDVIVFRSQRRRRKPSAGNVGRIMLIPVDFVCESSTVNASKLA